MLESKPFSLLVAARLSEFFAEKSAWFRGLWDVGTVLTLQELLETAALSPDHPEAVEWLAKDVRAVVAKDQGLPLRTRLEIDRLLDPTPGSYDALARLVETIDAEYLSLWASAIVENETTPKISVERTARAIATYLLGIGFSQSFLHRWLKYRVEISTTVFGLSQLVTEAGELVHEPLATFSILVPVNGALDRSQAPASWLDATAARSWLLSNGFAPIQQGGAWVIDVEARDKYAAIAQASEWVDRVSARLRVGAQKNMRDVGHAYVAGERRPLALRRERRIEVGSLQRQSQLFKNDAEGVHQIDAAFELLAHAEGPPVVAVGTGWAAIEAVLISRGDKKVIAAERMAHLVACSFARAELTLLASTQIRLGNSPLQPRFAACRTNKERAAVMLDALVDPAIALVWADHRQQAAVGRMKTLLARPGAGLNEITQYAHRVFRRLYRQRNLVLHGGVTRSVALGATLRTAPPLLGAGMDRIAHAWFEHRVQPIELAARAKMRLDLVGKAGAAGLVELLE